VVNYPDLVGGDAARGDRSGVHDDTHEPGIAFQPELEDGQTSLRSDGYGHRVGHLQATQAAIDLERLAPERIVLLPREANPAFHDAVVSTCHDAGLSPTFVEVAEPRIEHLLLTVAAGSGIGLVPESAADQHLTPGISFLALEGTEPVVQTAVVTRAA